MDNGIIAVRYAKALLKFSKENKEETAVYDEMKQLSGALLRVEGLHNTLLNPTFSTVQLRELLVAAGGATSKSYVRFMDLLIENKRVDLVDRISVAYQTLYREEKHLTTGRLTMASQPTKTVEDRMRTLLAQRTDHSVDFEVNVDPEIQGGFILEYDCYRMDASVKGQLRELHRALRNG